jgi:hypothetical protein
MERDAESRHEVLQHELVNELKMLRAAVRETAEGFILCKEGEIETLLDYLLKMPPGKLKNVVQPWMQKTRALKLKPAKGRIKDLKKINNLLTDLFNSAIEADDQEQKPKAAKKRVRRASSVKAAPAEEMQVF